MICPTHDRFFPTRKCPICEEEKKKTLREIYLLEREIHELERENLTLKVR